ncbi:hypothetical protein DXA92_07920 [Agathobaculum butyriciproducens]|nr:hypothetical protein DXA94_02815 [Agathobaculum butyriciproducens]RGC60863.1 hypothetical protein DXA92_07920 [Agathobaculum butyriciproducens]
MYYIIAKEIVAKCIEVGILQAHDGGILVYHDASQTEPEKYPEGWYLDSEEDVVHSLMADAEGQRTLLEALEEKGVSMQYRIKYWDKMLNNSPFN